MYNNNDSFFMSLNTLKSSVKWGSHTEERPKHTIHQRSGAHPPLGACVGQRVRAMQVQKLCMVCHPSQFHELRGRRSVPQHKTNTPRVDTYQRIVSEHQNQNEDFRTSMDEVHTMHSVQTGQYLTQIIRSSLLPQRIRIRLSFSACGNFFPRRRWL